jgi:hypothetical protein
LTAGRSSDIPARHNFAPGGAARYVGIRERKERQCVEIHALMIPKMLVRRSIIVSGYISV